MNNKLKTLALTALALGVTLPLFSIGFGLPGGFRSSVLPELKKKVEVARTQTVEAASTPTQAFSPTISPTFSVSPTFSETPTASPTATATPTPTATRTATESLTPSFSPTASPTSTATRTATESNTHTYSPTPTATPTASPTATQSATSTASATRTVTPTNTALPIINRVLGNGSAGSGGDDVDALSIPCPGFASMATDGDGNLFGTDYSNHRIFMLSTAGRLYIYGNALGTAGSGGDGGNVRDAQFNSPNGIVADPAGNLYVAETSGHRIRKIAPNGLVSTIAGDGTAASTGDGGPVGAAQLNFPSGLALDGLGNLYVRELVGGKTRKINSLGNISTVNIGGSSGIMCGAAAGGFYYANNTNFALYFSSPSGLSQTVAGGNGDGATGDGGPALAASIGSVYGMVEAPDGSLVFSDTYTGKRLRAVDSAGNMRAYAGDGNLGSGGDGGPALSASFITIAALARDLFGNVFVHDFNANTLRKIGTHAVPSATITKTATISPTFSASPTDTASPSATPTESPSPTDSPSPTASPTATITPIGYDSTSTVVGNGTLGPGGDGVQGTSTSFTSPYGTVSDPDGNIYFTNFGGNRVYKLATDGVVTILANISGTAGSSGNGGQARLAQLNGPTGICRDSAGNLYVAEYYGHRIRKIASNGVITTLAGTGSAGYDGGALPATSSRLYTPLGVAVDPSGDVYIADYGNNSIRRVSAGIMDDYASSLQPVGVLWGSDGYLYHSYYHTIDRLDAPFSSITIAGGNGLGDGGDGGPATSATLGYMIGMAMGPDGSLYLADQNYHRIRVLKNGVINAFAGSGTPEYSGDGGPGMLAGFNLPSGLALDPFGNMYVGDAANNSLRKIGMNVVPTPTPTP